MPVQVTLGVRAGIVTVVATQKGDGTYIDTRIEYLLAGNKKPESVTGAWDSDPACHSHNSYMADTTPIEYTASSRIIQGIITYSSSDSSVAAVNELDGIVTPGWGGYNHHYGYSAGNELLCWWLS